MWFIVIVVITLVSVRVFNKLSCGKCTSDAVMTGKVVIVTGANSGIGYETAKDLARRGARVILACRNESYGIQARDKIRSETKRSNVEFMKIDLASLDSVRQFVEEFKKTEVKLDVLVNNAGAAALGRTLSADGIITEMQINYFGAFLLTMLLVPLLKKSEAGRVVNVSSVLHYFGNIDFDKINKEKAYGDLQTYSNSKLCNVLFSNELARRLNGSNVVSHSLHPGHIRTNIYKHAGTFVENTMKFILSIWFKNAKEGAQTSIHVAVAEECEQVNGKYYVDCSEASMSTRAQDKELAARLWLYSEKLVKLKLTETI